MQLHPAGSGRFFGLSDVSSKYLLFNVHVTSCYGCTRPASKPSPGERKERLRDNTRACSVHRRGVSVCGRMIDIRMAMLATMFRSVCGGGCTCGGVSSDASECGNGQAGRWIAGPLGSWPDGEFDAPTRTQPRHDRYTSVPTNSLYNGKALRAPSFRRSVHPKPNRRGLMGMHAPHRSPPTLNRRASLPLSGPPRRPVLLPCPSLRRGGQRTRWAGSRRSEHQRPPNSDNPPPHFFRVVGAIPSSSENASMHSGLTP